jgi:hypothetical protein
MAPIVRIAAGEELAAALLPDDFAYYVHGNVLNDTAWCSPCQVVRVSLSVNGRFTARASWMDTATELHLWVLQTQRSVVEAYGSGDMTASIDASGGEVQVYIGRRALCEDCGTRTLPAPVTFRLRTSVEASS